MRYAVVGHPVQNAVGADQRRINGPREDQETGVDTIFRGCRALPDRE